MVLLGLLKHGKGAAARKVLKKLTGEYLFGMWSFIGSKI